ncbi:diguanylate cyclase GcbA [Oceaniserpentilla sp. 4NH20-0058]|uniref:diguanylate cyclase n=1 Tax=Oceaniserpentilla sp. 4NH20-0058 TaxID=3127660 RepID=UPI00310C5093
MSHIEKESASNALKRHFASRVSNQIRVLINAWRRSCEQGLAVSHLNKLIDECEKLVRHSLRFNIHHQHDHALVILEMLNEANNSNQINELQQQALQHAIDRLGQSSLRKTDNNNLEQIPKPKPVILAVQPDYAAKLSEQFNHFGITSQIAKDNEHFYQLQESIEACAYITDIHFMREHNGLELMSHFVKLKQTDTPIIFITEEESASIEQRLEAQRAGCLRFYVKPAVSQLIRTVERYYSPQPEEPFQVLIVDDSRSQALFCDKTLSKAGMNTHVLTDPMKILDALDEFQPEIIVMDMYMPGCTGTEIASAIRQQSHLIGVPILFLSGEEDIDIQLDAMSQGGDDFLTKPINPDHLVMTVSNRARRARVLNNLIIRDSLTGLFNHTYILDKLKQACRKAKDKQQPLSFAMVDIDFFKKINDNYGHPVGDKVILALSLFLKQRLRSSDSIGRYGGEEFAIILPNTTTEQALSVMNNIRQGFNQLEHSADDKDFHVSFSCGICSLTSNNGNTIIEHADQALYAAKKQGRNNVQIFIE